MSALDTGGPGATVPCGTCATAVDPLRAERVAIYNERFVFFCSAECREGYRPSTSRTPLPRPRDRRSDPGMWLATPTPTLPQQPRTPEPARTGRESPREEPSQAEPATPPVLDSNVSTATAPAGAGSLLLGLSAVGGALSIALALAGRSDVALTARLVLGVVACGALIAEAWMGEREEVELHPLALLAAPVLATALATAARVSSSPHASEAITLGSLIVALAASAVLLVRRSRQPLDAERALITSELDQTCQRVVGEDLVEARAQDLRPGEELVIDAGHVVPVDAVVTAGNAEVAPWLGSSAREPRGEGDIVVAGARVHEGTLRAVVSWAGADRAWTRVSVDRRRRADLEVPLGRAGRLIAERLAPFISGAAALAAMTSNLDLVELGMLTLGVHAGLTGPALAAAPALRIGRAILDGLRRGIAFRSAEGFDRAGRVSTLAFSARGTLLLGEPVVANIEAFGTMQAEDVLALVAGAEGGSQRAASTAILRAARERGIRPDGVRSPTPQPGLGTTAVASSGQPLVVGSRALMLREHVSVAAAERRITDLEALGRSVLLVALGGRLVGLLGLQDGLRPGARAAVQHVLDVGVEPVLISGDARETCEALGRALDVDHIRPEIPPAERGAEIRRLADGGAVVAVVGRSPPDDVALAAANVSIALGAAGSPATEYDVQLASDDVRDAAYAVRLAHDARREARLALLLALCPAALAALMAALGLIGPALPPLAGGLGGLLSLSRIGKRH